MRRIGRTDVTWPNVGELTTVSIEANWTVLNTLLASSWIDRPRVSPKEMLRVNPRFMADVPGPMIVFRPALPKVPGAGIENAAALKNNVDVGSANSIG